MIPSNLMHLDADISRVDRNQVQLALALADKDMLTALLVNCLPAIALPHQVGQIRISIGPPPGTAGLERLSAVLEYEHIWCIPSEGAPTDDFTVKDLQSLTRCQSDLKTLGWRVNLSEAIGLLQHGGFEEKQIQRILQLPWEGWHRSWWDTIEPQGTLGLPFQRWFRTRCYSDGTYTLQYRDHYPQDAPRCFRGLWQQVPIIIGSGIEQFGETLADFRKACHTIETDCCILLADELTDLEAEGYMRQGVSLYSLYATDLTRQPICQRCANRKCPMNGKFDAPIVDCKAYKPLSTR